MQAAEYCTESKNQDGCVAKHMHCYNVEKLLCQSVRQETLSVHVCVRLCAFLFLPSPLRFPYK